MIPEEILTLLLFKVEASTDILELTIINYILIQYIKVKLLPSADFAITDHVLFPIEEYMDIILPLWVLFKF